MEESSSDKEKLVMIDGKLESRIFNFSESSFVVLLSHPHPKLGGDFNNNVVLGISGVLRQKHISYVRFNTRGIGSSAGASTWSGTDEREDFIKVIAYVKKEMPSKKICLCAYSFGAAVGLSVVTMEKSREKNVDALVCIGYPKGLMSSMLFSDHYKYTNGGPIPKLFILGDSDNFTSVSTLEELVKNADEPKQMKIYPDCDHFYGGKEQLLGQDVIEFLSKL